MIRKVFPKEIRVGGREGKKGKKEVQEGNKAGVNNAA
jgi:hypothetical protein